VQQVKESYDALLVRVDMQPFGRNDLPSLQLPPLFSVCTQQNGEGQAMSACSCCFDWFASPACQAHPLAQLEALQPAAGARTFHDV
jgi:hypothetical protein